jgi:hypothetical protein
LRSWTLPGHVQIKSRGYTFRQNTRFTALRRECIERNFNVQDLDKDLAERVQIVHITPILIALVGVLPLAVAGLSLLFVSGNSTPHNPHHHAINLWDLK